ncbi:MAG: L,D-transpeptidase family protein [SAR324 cluster bacterium]|nr:L,D-transpeptidase family protein [SAR324 cluster bacterium]
MRSLTEIIKRWILFIILFLFISHLQAQTYLPDGLILYNKPGATALIVDKTECSVTVFQNQSIWEKVLQYQCTTGKNQGDKQQEGDARTPTGLYFFTDAWTGKELINQYGSSAQIYGAGAFELNYPNHLDQVLYNKNGSGIWLHGTDKGYPAATKGCISTTNTDFLEVAQHISLFETPLIIEESVAYVAQEKIKKVRSELLEFIKQWKTNWESGQTETYLSFYSKNFKTQKFNYRRWKQFKKLVNKKNKKRKIKISEISILKAKGIYNIQFTQHFTSTGTNDLGRKQLYVANEQGNFRIISETWQPIKSPRSSLSHQYALETNSDDSVIRKFRKQTL